MPVEFLGYAATNDGTETQQRTGPSFDPDYTIRLARAHEEWGWDRVLFAYGSGSPDPAAATAYVAAHTERLQLLLAHRPNVSYPTYAAKTFATLDRIAGGRLMVHFITGGDDTEQAREGDFLSMAERYARTGEYIKIVKRAWTEREPFSHHGWYFDFDEFVSDVFPAAGHRPLVSVGGCVPEAYAVGAAESDVYCLWGEPLERTFEQIEAIRAASDEVGREVPPRIQVSFRPIIAETEERAWDKAYRILAEIKGNRRLSVVPAQSTGSRRLIAIAGHSERFDRALWTPAALATNGADASHALVGTPDTVAQALLDYYDLGAEIFSCRGYDLLPDAEEFGRHVIPIVREEVAKRDAARAAGGGKNARPGGRGGGKPGGSSGPAGPAASAGPAGEQSIAA
ncbi:MAG TPA: LLM class flavin-dependent oxidoreductase [Actinospica sp.]|jgi:alkanesulfonate monooxygenase|nr:LLM class flavin-dependent oxidoreductase [Actinospica sp.]